MSDAADASRADTVATVEQDVLGQSAPGDGSSEPSDARNQVTAGSNAPLPMSQPPLLRRAFTEPTPSMLTSGIPQFMVKRAAYLVGASEEAQRYERLQ